MKPDYRQEYEDERNKDGSGHIVPGMPGYILWLEQQLTERDEKIKQIFSSMEANR